jgi:hypothetical protein
LLLHTSLGEPWKVVVGKVSHNNFQPTFLYGPCQPWKTVGNTTLSVPRLGLVYTPALSYHLSIGLALLQGLSQPWRYAGPDWEVYFGSGLCQWYMHTMPLDHPSKTFPPPSTQPSSSTSGFPQFLMHWRGSLWILFACHHLRPRFFASIKLKMWIQTIIARWLAQGLLLII